jgi:hypothetical protein
MTPGRAGNRHRPTCTVPVNTWPKRNYVEGYMPHTRMLAAFLPILVVLRVGFPMPQVSWR